MSEYYGIINWEIFEKSDYSNVYFKGEKYINTLSVNGIKAIISKRAGFIPIKANAKASAVQEGYSLFYRLEGGSLCFLELFSGDAADAGELEKLLNERPDTDLEPGTDRSNTSYIKIFAFNDLDGEILPETEVEAFNKYISAVDSLSAIIMTLKGKHFFELGVKYPHLGVYSILKSYTDKSGNSGFSLDEIIKGKKSSLAGEGDGKEDKGTHFIAYVYLFAWAIGFTLESYTQGGKYYIFSDSGFPFFIANLIALILVGELVENNYGTRKLMAIILVGGLMSNIPIEPSRVFYDWMMPVIGAFLYLCFRVNYTLRRNIVTSCVFVLYVAAIAWLTNGNEAAGGLKEFLGIPVGFIIASVLGFEKEAVSEGIRRLFVISFIFTAITCITAGVIL